MTPTQEQPRTLFFEGIGHYEAGRLAEACAAFERCRALTPERPSVLGKYLHSAPIRHEQSKAVPGAYIHLRCNR